VHLTPDKMDGEDLLTKIDEIVKKRLNEIIERE
jgi:hypothetical protein